MGIPMIELEASSWASSLCIGLFNLRQEDSYCDCNIRTASGDVLRAHKVVLAAASSVFNLDLSKSSESDLCYLDINTETFLNVLNFIYDGKVSVTSQNFAHLHQAAQHFGLTDLLSQMDIHQELHPDVHPDVKPNIHQDCLLQHMISTVKPNMKKENLCEQPDPIQEEMNDTIQQADYMCVDPNNTSANEQDVKVMTGLRGKRGRSCKITPRKGKELKAYEPDDKFSTPHRPRSKRQREMQNCGGQYHKKSKLDHKDVGTRIKTEVEGNSGKAVNCCETNMNVMEGLEETLDDVIGFASIFGDVEAANKFDLPLDFIVRWKDIIGSQKIPDDVINEDKDIRVSVVKCVREKGVALASIKLSLANDLVRRHVLVQDYIDSTDGKVKSGRKQLTYKQLKRLKRMVVSEKPKKESELNKIKCEFCEEEFTVRAYKAHILENRMNMRRCVSRKEKFMELQMDCLNVDTVSLKIPLQCNICKEDFNTKTNLFRHCRLAHPDDREKALEGHLPHSIIQCPVCSVKIRKKEIANHLWNVHEKREEGEKFAFYKCKDCGFKTRKRQDYIQHEQAVHKGEIVPRFMCDICGEKFKRSASLRLHQNIHTDSRPVQCPYCDKSFRKTTALRQHLPLHTGYKPYRCNICNKGYTQLTSINLHLQKHHDIPKELFKENRTYKSMEEGKADELPQIKLSSRSMIRHGRTRSSSCGELSDNVVFTKEFSTPSEANYDEFKPKMDHEQHQFETNYGNSMEDTHSNMPTQYTISIDPPGQFSYTKTESFDDTTHVKNESYAIICEPMSKRLDDNLTLSFEPTVTELLEMGNANQQVNNIIQSTPDNMQFY